MASTSSKGRRLLSTLLLLFVMVGFFLSGPTTSRALREALLVAIALLNVDLIFTNTSSRRLRASAIAIMPVICVIAWLQHQFRYGPLSGFLGIAVLAAVSFAAAADARRRTIAVTNAE
jgi:hypothetical protein